MSGLNVVDKTGRTLLFWAAEKGYKAMVQRLLDKGAAINAADTFDQTPLSWAT
jgi:ankyrin repeat protein